MELEGGPPTTIKIVLILQIFVIPCDYFVISLFALLMLLFL